VWLELVFHCAEHAQQELLEGSMYQQDWDEEGVPR
jgi:hypothetical protein